VPEPPGSRTTIGHAGLAAEHEADLRRLIDDLLHRQRDEIGELDLEHGRMPVSAAPTAAPASPSSLIGVSITRSGPKRFRRSARHAEGAAVHADVLAEQEHARIGLHRLREAFAYRLRVGQLLRLGQRRRGELNGIDIPRQLQRIGVGARFREFERILDLPCCRLLDGGDLRRLRGGLAPPVRPRAI
jgi:hypothetical protein